MLQILNNDRTPTALLYYGKYKADGTRMMEVKLLPGINLVPEETMAAVKFGTPAFPYSHIERTDFKALPAPVAVDVVKKSVSIGALEILRLDEERPAVRRALDEKIKQRTAALASVEAPIPEESEDEPGGLPQ
jgi:hypothetical protein